MHRLFCLLAKVVLWFRPEQKSFLIGNLTPLLGPRAPEVAPRVLGHVFTNTYDFLFRSRALQAALNVEGFEHVEAAYRSSGRVMLVTAHFGHWELGLPRLVANGYAVAGLYAPFENSFWARWIHTRRDPRIEWIRAVPGAARQAEQALEARKVLGIVADLPFGESGETVSIAGHRARLAMGPWLLAARTQAIVIPGFILREPSGNYRIIYHPPLCKEGKDARAQAQSYLSQYADLLSSYLLRTPEQWGVLQPFWAPEVV